MSAKNSKSTRSGVLRRNGTFHAPQAVEGYLKMLAANMADAVAQIEGKAYPQYDANCRRNILEEALSFVKTREQQKHLDPAYPTPKVAVAGLKSWHFPSNTSLGDMRKIQRYLKVGATPSVVLLHKPTKSNPRKPARATKRNPGWHPYEVGGVKHYSKPVPTGGRVVVIEPYRGWEFFQVLYYPGEGYAGQQHYSNDNSLAEAKATGERAINYYSGRSANKMGRMHRPNPGKRPAARKAAPRRNPHESMTEQQASDTIAALGGMGKLRAMIGADNFIRGYETDGTPALSFKFKGCKTANYARIALDPSDTYTLRLFKIRGYEAKPVYEASDLYAENLRPAFERATGLYLSLGTMKGNPGKVTRKTAKRPVAHKVGRRNPHSIHPYVVFEEWRTTGFPKKHIAILSAASGVDKKEMEQHFKGYVHDPEAEDYDELYDQVENGIVDRYGMPTAAEYAESRAALKAGGSKAPARSSVKKAPKGPPPLSKFKQHPYFDFSVWQGDYNDQSAAKVVALASGVPLKTIKASFGNGKEDDRLTQKIEAAILDRYGSPWADNPRKARARRMVSR